MAPGTSTTPVETRHPHSNIIIMKSGMRVNLQGAAHRHRRREIFLKNRKYAILGESCQRKTTMEKMIINQAERIFTLAASDMISRFNQLPGMDRLAVSRQTITSERIPSSFSGFKMAVMGDLHGHWFGKDQERLYAALSKEKPDIILFAGDWMASSYYHDRNSLIACARVFSRTAPSFSILGNHETRSRHVTSIVQDIEESGVRMLLDETTVLQKGGQSLLLTGLVPEGCDMYDAKGHLKKEILMRRYQKGKEAVRHVSSICVLDGQKESEVEKGGLYRILLGHQPELLPMYARLQADLVLSGHAHGGFMKLPSGRRLLAPGQGLFPRYSHGRYVRGSSVELVTDGLGGPRIGIAPQIMMVTLKKGTADS